MASSSSPVIRFPKKARPLGIVPESTTRYQLHFDKRVCRLAPHVVEAWEELLEQQKDQKSAYQSPQYFRYLASKQNGRDLGLAIVTNGSRRPVGIVPVQVGDVQMTFKISYQSLARFRFRAAAILGGPPLIPENVVLYDVLLEKLWARFQDCTAICMRNVPTDSLLWRHIHESREILDKFYVYVPYGARKCHTSPMPETFQQYLAKYTRKKRYNLRCQLKLLRARGSGNIELKRLASLEDVPQLLRAMAELMPRPEMDAEAAEMLASHGLLLCYLLICGGKPCALAIGSRYHDVYTIGRTTYDPSFKRFSPGTSLQYLLVEDLLTNGLARSIDFGYGEPIGPYRSANVIVERGNIFFFRKTFANRVRIASHMLFHSLVSKAKRF